MKYLLILKEGNHFPWSPGWAPVNRSSSAVGLCCQGTLLSHTQLVVFQDPQVLFHRATPQCPVCFIIRCSSFWAAGLNIFIEFWRFLLAHLFGLSRSGWQPGSLAFKWTDLCSQFSVICKLSESAPYHLLQVTDKNVKEDMSTFRPLWCSPVTGLQIEYDILNASLWV